jgi:hypothetical protein
MSLQTMMWLFIECLNQYAFDVPLYPTKRIFIDLAFNLFLSSFGTKHMKCIKTPLNTPLRVYGMSIVHTLFSLHEFNSIKNMYSHLCDFYSKD